MVMLDHQYERGWRVYGFGNLPFEEKAIHGASATLSLCNIFNRGYNKPHITFATIYPTDQPAIGMHIHRDAPTGDDTEEWYIIIEGEAESVFSNGDVVRCHAGDLIEIHPGTGHSFRAVGGPVRLISITPDMFRYNHEYLKLDTYPEKFDPRIRVDEINDTLNVLRATCTVCGAEWNCREDDTGASDLPVWARKHRHGEQEIEE